MRRIEFFGPGCSGKSTLFLHAFSTGDKYLKRHLVKEYDIKCKYILKYSSNSLFWKTVLKSIPLNSSVMRSLTDGRILPKTLDALSECNCTLTTLIDHVLYNAKRQDVFVSNDLRRRYMFTKSITDYIAINKVGWDGVLLQDEGLLQRGISLSLFDGSPEDFLSQYVELCPLPDAAIYVQAPANVIRKRVMSRPERYAINYYIDGFIERDTNISKKMVEALTEREVTVLVPEQPNTKAEVLEFIRWVNEA